MGGTPFRLARVDELMLSIPVSSRLNKRLSEKANSTNEIWAIVR